MRGVQGESQHSEQFKAGVGVHQGSVLGALIFSLVLEVPNQCKGVPWEQLYAYGKTKYLWQIRLINALLDSRSRKLAQRVKVSEST